MVQDGGGGKLRNTGEVLTLQILHGVQAAAGQEGILDAGGQEIAKAYLQIEAVQFFQEAVPRIIGEVGQMVAVDFIHGAAGHLHDLAPHIPSGGGAVPLF